MRETHNLYIFLLLSKSGEHRNEQFRRVRLVCNFIRQTANCGEWRNLSDECVTMPADLIAVSVSRETSNKRPVAFSFGLSIRRCELWLAIRRFDLAIADVSTNNLLVVRYSCECFPSRDPRIIFPTKNASQTAILKICLDDLCTAQMRFRIFT